MADILYVDSGYVDDHYFTYTADASSIVSASATLTVSSSRVYYGTVLVFPTATLTANANAIYRLGGGGTAVPGTTSGDVAGLVSNSSQMTVYAEPGFTNPNYNGAPRPVLDKDVFAIWAKKDSVSSTNGTLFSFGSTTYRYENYGQSFGHISLKVLDTSVLLTVQVNFLTGGPTVYTSNLSISGVSPAFKFDSNWHHYMLEIGTWDVDSLGNVSSPPSFRLWQDGTMYTFPTPTSGGSTINQYALVWTSNTFFIGADAPRPTNQTYIDTDGYRGPYVAPAVDGWNGTLAQFWYGNFDLNVSGNPAKLYNNGYVDVTTSGAPTPIAYASFIDPTDQEGATYYTRFGDAEQITASAGSFVGYTGDNTPLNLESNFACFFGIGRIKTSSATLATSATITAITGPLKQFSATLSSTFTVSKATAVTTQQGSATGLVVTATISRATANPIKEITITLASEFSLRGRSTTAVYAQTTLSSEFSQRIVTSASAKSLAVESSIYAYSVKTRLATSALVTQSTLTANGGLYFNGQFNIQPVFSLRVKLTVVPIPDDLQTIFVGHESRGLRVVPETRFTSVESESNLNRVLMETRDIEVPYESRQLREAVEPVITRTTERIRRIPA